MKNRSQSLSDSLATQEQTFNLEVDLLDPFAVVTHEDVFILCDAIILGRKREGFNAINEFTAGMRNADIYMIGYQQALDTVKRELNANFPTD